MYTTKHAQRLYNVKSDQTIRNWIRDFEDFFSVNATPGKGVDLQLTVEDMQILDLIASMRAERRPPDEIRATLQSGQRGKAPEYSPEELDTLTKGDYERFLSTQLDELQLQNEELTRKLKELEGAVGPLRDENIQLRTEKAGLESQLSDVKKQLNEALDRIAKLSEEKGEAYYRGLYDAIRRQLGDDER